MKKILLIAAFIFSGIISSSAQEKHTVTLQFEGIKSNKGKLYVAVYNNKKSFLKKAFKGAIVKIEDNKAIVILEDIPTGVYAVSAFHDANDNKKMDTNFFGIPKEPIGVSNNAKGFMGPPKYKDAKFEVKKNITLSINVK
ncbi:MAG: DUF2141 domain-containing protein [Flavobacteriaceae bacterium]